MSNLNNYLSFINESALSDTKELFVGQCEQRYTSILTSIAQKIHQGEAHEIVLLAGPSCAGKTTSAKLIAQALKAQGRAVFTVSLDDFYKDTADAIRDENGIPDFETVHALDLPCLHNCLNELIHFGRAELPLFDFQTGKRKEQTHRIELSKGDVVVVEGLHALNPLITQQLPQEYLLRLYVNVSTRIYDGKGKIVLNKRNLRFVRRVVRDYHFRNSSVENTCRLWESVTRGEEQYLFPFKDTADLKINSIHLYEPCVLRNQALPLFYEVPQESPYYRDIRRLCSHLERFAVLPASLVPEESLLREFIGDEGLK